MRKNASLPSLGSSGICKHGLGGLQCMDGVLHGESCDSLMDIHTYYVYI